MLWEVQRQLHDSICMGVPVCPSAKCTRRSERVERGSGFEGRGRNIWGMELWEKAIGVKREGLGKSRLCSVDRIAI